ncbi:hypothetical protein ABL78_7460 [Leptomonas seymouri]|uniref:Amino acid transporter transmembrane domain-containing protein n=1 Tax=Leptomonas seymouri TaxID=5684 RepID=A0A0N0P3C5_LEPSE|nr:hypothetical protein ABL78_7460 [Leptomonas seymouri]|eukprot:KPI83507.1 hypothetical protein ABL78_7460 [Leptomonas seymouri]
MSRSSSETAEPHADALPPTSKPLVSAFLERLRDASGGGEGERGVASTSHSEAVRLEQSSESARAASRSMPAATLPLINTGIEPAMQQGTTHVQISQVGLGPFTAAGLYAFQSPATAAAPEAAGASAAQQYFHVSPLSSTSSSYNDSAQTSTITAEPILPPQQSTTLHAISVSSSSISNNDSVRHNDGAQTASAQAPHAPHQRTSSVDTDSELFPPRSPVRPLTAEEAQLARIRAYNEMFSMDASDSCEADGQRSFLADTATTLLPDGVTRWLADSTDVIAQQSSAVVHEGVKHAASVAASTIGSGAQRIGDVIDHVPGMIVSSIPAAVMSNEVKQLLFTDFSNTFRSFFHTNILSMPFVIRQAGLVGGVFLLTFVSITSEYATEAYFGAKNQMKSARRVVVYGDVPMMVWGKWYPMINIFYGVTHLIGFTAFSASNSVVLLGAMGMTGGGARALSLIIPSLIALPLVLMKNAHSQEPLAITSNVLVIAAVLLMFVDFPYAPSPPIKLWPTSATEFFVAMGISVYAFTGIGSTIPVERVMSPRRYRKLLRLSVALAYAILLAFGISGFLSYGDHTCSVMTMSLQEGPLRTAVSALLFFASIAIIPQQTFPLCELSDRRLLGIRHLTAYWDLKPNIMRIGYLILSAFAAFIVPYYGLLLSIAGALGCGIVGLVVPAALDYVRRERKGLHHNRTLHLYEYLIVFGLGFYGCVVVVVGVVSGSYQLWTSVQAQSTDTC